MNTNELYDQIFRIQELKFIHKNKPTNKLVVCIAGTISSGKSTLAKKIELNLSGIRISTDEARYIFKNIVKDNSQVLNVVEYVKYILPSVLKYENHLIILDASIDRVFEGIKSLCRQIEYPLFVASIDTDTSVLFERMQKRNQTDEEGIGKMISTEAFDKSAEDHRMFLAKFVPDISIDDTSEIQIASVVTAVKQKLSAPTKSQSQFPHSVSEPKI